MAQTAVTATRRRSSEDDPLARPAATPVEGRRTRIVATLGPATESPQAIAGLIRAGADVLRLNLSHGDHDSHRLACERAREAALALERPAAVLADLCGPKLRVGRLPEGGMMLADGGLVRLVSRSGSAGSHRIPITLPSLPTDLGPGSRVLLDDGRLELWVEDADDDGAACRVLRGGRLVAGKGVNLPGSSLALPSLTAKDRADLSFAVRLGVDFVALSFVRTAADVHHLRRMIRSQKADPGPLVVAKIETQQALAAIDEILDVADGIMIARGDLGVEIGCERVPIVQDDLVARARAAHKPVIVATQMLESMVGAPVPTRAEVADVAHAVASGADATMLSAETATGRYPAEAVAAMARIARSSEVARATVGEGPAWGPSSGANDALASVGRHAAQLASQLGASAILVLSQDREALAAIASARPASPIVVPVASWRDARQLALVAGVTPLAAPNEPGPGHVAPTRELVDRIRTGADGPVITVTPARTVDGDRVSLVVDLSPQQAGRRGSRAGGRSAALDTKTSARLSDIGAASATRAGSSRPATPALHTSLQERA
jgi:pyruvate kinase